MDKMFNVIKKWKTKEGFQAVIITMSIGERFHHCGYVGIDKGHPFYKVGYSEDKPSFFPGEDYPSMACCLEVHGGVTYSGGDGKYPIKSELYWIGFDCAHANDTLQVQNLEYCIAECEKLSDQLRKMMKFSTEYAGKIAEEVFK